MILSLSKNFYNIFPTILILDSGIGGLSVYSKVKQLLPNINYIYVFDNVGFPYGEKSDNFIVERIINIVDTIIRKYYFQISLVIIACNTASIVSLPMLRMNFSSIPIVGVVPAVKTASILTKNGTIGILATRSTIKSVYVYQLFRQFASTCRIKMLGSNDLVLLSEAKLQGQSICLSNLYYFLKPWLNDNFALPDTIILGCTHFAFLKNELQSIFPSNVIFIDSSLAIARQVNFLLKQILPQNIMFTKINLKNNNIAFCTSLNYNAQKLCSILKIYKFSSLEELSLKM